MPSRLWGRAEATRTVLRTLAVALAPLVFGVVSDALGSGSTATSGIAYHASASGLAYTFMIMLAPMAVGGLLLLRGSRSYARDVATALASERAIERTRDPCSALEDRADARAQPLRQRTVGPPATGARGLD
jgi:hypothetical protein